MGTRHFIHTRPFTINFDDIVLSSPAPSESDAICQQIADMLTPEAYQAWVEAGPDDNPAFLEYAREKLADELAADDKQRQEAEAILDWFAIGSTPTDIALESALYNMTHASPENREWAERRYAEEVEKALRNGML